jgi:hypothetical protein
MHLPDSPILNISYASHVTTPPGSLLQHHLRILQSVCLCQRIAYVDQKGHVLPMARSDAVLVLDPRQSIAVCHRRRP